MLDFISLLSKKTGDLMTMMITSGASCYYLNNLLSTEQFVVIITANFAKLVFQTNSLSTLGIFIIRPIYSKHHLGCSYVILSTGATSLICDAGISATTIIHLYLK